MTDDGRAACPSCGAVLPVAFPGATIACACGHRSALAEAGSALRRDASPTSSAQPGGPYRLLGAVHDPVRLSPCPYCGNDCPPLVRICPHCDVRLDTVRCQTCFSLQAPGGFACLRCSRPLELEPLFDATDAPCPRCRRPLEISPVVDSRAHECPRCGGIFVGREMLAEILCAAEMGGALREGPPKVAHDLDVVCYVPCPLCHASMNRTNFGRASGVIVDVCKSHGTWFDAGELTRVVAFVASGGLARTAAREEKESKQRRASDVDVRLRVGELEDPVARRLARWQEFVLALLYF